MQSRLAKSLRNEFEARLRRKYPGFTKIPADIPGYRRYMWSIADDLALYIELEIFSKYDSFNISVGFGEPNKSPRPYFPVTPESAVHQAGEFRLSRLMPGMPDGELVLDPNSKIPFGQPLPVEESIAKIPQALDELFSRIVTYAIPFFERVAKLRGKMLFAQD